MYILIKFSEDGDSMILLNDLDQAKEKFSEARSEMDGTGIEQISLLKVEVGVEFGSGSWGDFFGGEIIDNYVAEN